MNQEFNMKKLTALLLGTVISIAFTASDAFADKAMKYWNSNDGRTGGYLGLSYNYGSIDDVKANYLRKGSDSTWALDDGEGGRVQFGFDFGKIRFDWRLGGLYSSVQNIDGTQLTMYKHTLVKVFSSTNCGNLSIFSINRKVSS